MKEPWSKKTGLAKAIAIAGATFLIGLGLCGVNTAATIGFGVLVPGANWVGALLGFTGVAELLIILVSGLLWLVLSTIRSNKK